MHLKYLPFEPVQRKKANKVKNKKSTKPGGKIQWNRDAVSGETVYGN
jgi:hypothetical protein